MTSTREGAAMSSRSRLAAGQQALDTMQLVSCTRCTLPHPAHPLRSQAPAQQQAPPPRQVAPAADGAHTAKHVLLPQHLGVSARQAGASFAIQVQQRAACCWSCMLAVRSQATDPGAGAAYPWPTLRSQSLLLPLTGASASASCSSSISSPARPSTSSSSAGQRCGSGGKGPNGIKARCRA